MLHQNAGLDEAMIKINYNRLCDQFANNSNYLPASVDYGYIPEDENISYEMTVNKKAYQTAFFQIDQSAILEDLKETLSSKYTAEQLANPTEEIQNEIIKLTYEIAEKKLVWFAIDESYGDYSLTIYYENGYNAADGSDL